MFCEKKINFAKQTFASVSDNRFVYEGFFVNIQVRGKLKRPEKHTTE